MRDPSPQDPRQVGPYRIAALLGTGGMGRVYLGLDREGGPAAVKVVRAEYAYDPDFRERFARELDLLRRVHGPHTPRVLAADPSGITPWAATEYVMGPSLRDLVRTTGPLPEQATRFIARGVASALARVHESGLVHRDLKPSNVMVSAAGPQVIDFGIARAMDETGEEARIIGTPGYMAPENIRREPGGAPSDVFALAGLIVYSSTGTGPFGEGSPSSVMYRAAHLNPVLSGVPESLRGLVTTCLDKDPDRRPSAARVLEDLGGPATPEPIAGGWLPSPAAEAVAAVGREYRAAVAAAAEDGRPPEPTRSTGPARGSRRRRPLLVGAAALLLTASAGTWATASLFDGEEPGGERPGERASCDITEHIAPEYARAAHDPPRLPSTPGKTANTAFSADGRVVAVGGDEGLALWDWRRGTEIARIEASIDPFQSAPLLSPDGCRIAYPADDGAHVYTIETGEHTVYQEGTAIGGMAFSGNGESLLLSDADAFGGALLRVSLDTDEITDVYDGITNAHRVTVSPEGRYVAAADHSGMVGVWDSASGKRLLSDEDAHTGLGNNLLLPNDEGDVLYLKAGGIVHDNFLDGGEARVFEAGTAPEGALSEIALNPAADRLYAGHVPSAGDGEAPFATSVWEFSTGRELTAAGEEPAHWFSVHPRGEVVTALPLDSTSLRILDPRDLSPLDSIG